MMFPSPEDKTMRSEGRVTINEPSPLDTSATLPEVCTYIAARLRYDFVCGRDSIAAHVDVTEPWNHPSYPTKPHQTIAGMYSALLEKAVFAALDEVLPLSEADAMINFIISKVIIKDNYRGTFRIFIKADVISSSVLASA